MFMTDMKGEFGGLGMTVGQQDGLITVIAPIEDTPAYNAGIKAGDVIVMIDNATTADMNTDEAVELMRGKPKTKVKLTIMRKDEPKPLEFSITRDIIRIKAVKYNMIGNDIGYVRFTSFQENSADEVETALEELQKQGAKGTILDLRNNPGGSLADAVNVVSLFLPANKTVVITKNRTGKAQPLGTRSFHYKDTTRPLVILVNEGSASASEIVAGAMQDHNRAMVVGTTTFGKASVQTVFDLRNGGAIKLTTARYYTPNNRSIQGVGIVPDMVVPQGQIVYDNATQYRKESDLAGHLTGENEGKVDNSTKKPAQTPATQAASGDTDLQLQSAIQILKGMALLNKNGK
jgi:carboxyl-terminal processing protease